jgi:hypothetical protein
MSAEPLSGSHGQSTVYVQGHGPRTFRSREVDHSITRDRPRSPDEALNHDDSPTAECRVPDRVGGARRLLSHRPEHVALLPAAVAVLPLAVRWDPRTGAGLLLRAAGGQHVPGPVSAGRSQTFAFTFRAKSPGARRKQTGGRVAPFGSLCASSSFVVPTLFVLD